MFQSYSNETTYAFKSMTKNYYREDHIFVGVRYNDYSTLSLFLPEDKGFHFIYASSENYLLKNFNMDTIEFVRKIMK